MPATLGDDPPDNHYRDQPSLTALEKNWLGDTAPALIGYRDEASSDDEVVLPYDYIPRDYQAPVWEAMFPRSAVAKAVRRVVLVWHRRAGKDKTCFNIVLAKAVERVGLYLYLLPTQTQARKVIWKGIGKDGKRFIDHIPEALIAKTNTTEMTVELINGSIIQLCGSDNYNALMGTNPVGIVLSEYSIQDPNAWEYFRPILAENEGWAIFEYTPRGHNHGYFMYQRALKLAKQQDSAWFVSLQTVDDTSAIPPEAIEEEREGGMSEQMIEQEFFCSFEAFNDGAIYGRQMQQAWKDGRVGFFPVDTTLPVFTFWDLGFGDANAIWFVQGTGRDVLLVGYMEASGRSMVDWIRAVKDWGAEKGVTFAEHWAPHDIDVHEYTTGQRRLDVAREHGIEFEIAPKVSLQDGIEAVRAILPLCRFDEASCERGINCLTEYHYEWDDTRKAWRAKPEHDWTSHGADAFRYLAVVWKNRVFHSHEPAQAFHPEQDWSPFDD